MGYSFAVGLMTQKTQHSMNSVLFLLVSAGLRDRSGKEKNGCESSIEEIQRVDVATNGRRD